MKKLIIMLAFILPVAFAFTGNTVTSLDCDTPTNVTKTGETATSVSYSWDAVSGADDYVLSYTPSGQANSGPIYVLGTSYTFSGLSAGTYTFYFAARCGESTSTDWIMVEDVLGG